jgi:hypothetical protein
MKMMYAKFHFQNIVWVQTPMTKIQSRGRDIEKRQKYSISQSKNQLCTLNISSSAEEES